MPDAPRTDWRGHPHRALLEEVAAAERAYRAATERRRRLIQDLMARPETERPSQSDLARALGLPRPAVGQLARSRPVYR